MKNLISRTLLALCASALGATTASAALIAHWPLDTDAADATGNGHDGTVVGGTVNFGQPGANASTGTSASFPDNGHIDVPFDAALNPGTQAPNGSGSFTVALWANLTVDNGAHNSPFTSREDNGVSVNGPIIYKTPGLVWSYWAGNNGPPGAWNPLNGPAVPLNTWQHVAITYDSATQTRKMFIDGTEVLMANLGVSANLLRDIHIGAGQDDGLNFFWSGLIDDVGIWDEALEQADIQDIIDNGIGGGAADPNLRAPSLLELTYDGVDGSFNIPINNTGATLDLNLGPNPVVGGPDASNFQVVIVPGPISPGGSANLECTFDPLGAAGVFEGTFDIASDDPLEPNKIVTVRMTFHDPFVSGPATIDFGTRSSSSGSETLNVTLENMGISTLNISDITLSGPDMANFSLGAFANIPGGGMADVELTFSPNGQEGSFSAELVIDSDDPITPSLTIPVIARVEFSNPLIAHWPLDTDASDATGNGFDGTIVGGGVNHGQPGANAATGGATSFDGSGHIDVAWDAGLNTGDFSVALWANASAAGGGSFRSPITNRDDVAPGGAFRHGFIIYNTNNGQWSFWNGGGTSGNGGWNTMDVGPVAINEWHHIAITYESATNTKTFYIDGSSVGTSNPANFSPNNSSAPDANPAWTYEDEDLHLGGGGDAGTSFRWEGLIDDIGLFRVALTEEEVMNAMNNGVASFGKTSKLPFSVSDAPGDMLTLRWDSQGGKLYNLRSVTDPSAPIAPGTEPPTPLEWPIFDGNADIAATAPENTLTIPRPADPERYFLIEEFNAPPASVFFDDFEGGQGSWTAGVDDVLAGDTFWEFGTPSNVGPAAANSGANCFGTNLAANYDVDADIWLRSPDIDLTTAGGATLNYAAWFDIEPMFDAGTVNILNAADDSVLAIAQATVEGASAGWEQVSVPIPAAALGNVIKLEFRFTSDNFQSFIGWYIDDVQVTVP